MSPVDPRPIVLDACVCINLAAAAIPLAEITQLVQRQVYVVAQAATEALFLHDEVDGEPTRKPIDLHVLDQVDLENEELRTYVALAARLDDGEAASLAVAHHRNWSFATDDRAARRAARALDPSIELVATLALLRICLDRAEVDPPQVARALLAVETQASFVPPRDDPDFAWWRAARNE